MEALLGTAGLIAVGAITPGPNNLVVLRASALSGWRGAFPAMAGIVVGGLALLALVVGGLNEVAALNARWVGVLSVGACLLLAACGLGLVLRSFGAQAHPAEAQRGAPLGGFGSLFAFQFLNPKSWLLVVAAVTRVGATPSDVAALAQLVALFLLIPALSLAVWSWAGALAMRHLESHSVRLWFDRVTGGLLTGFALLLLRGGS